MTTHHPARLGLLIAALWAPLGPATDAQTVSLARLDQGTATRDLLTFDADTGLPLARLTDLEFRAPLLAGRARVQRLRADLPNLRGEDSAAPRLRLPHGGSVYLVDQAGLERVLLVDGRGLPTTLLDSATAGGAGFQSWLAASDDGRRLLVATLDDRVWLLDTRGPRPARELTPSAPLTGVDGESLRVSANMAWLVADGRLLRAELNAPDPRFAPVPHPLTADERLFAELAVSGDGAHVAAVSEDAAGARRLLHAGPDGALAFLTDTAEDYDLPSLRAGAGPYLALSHDGSFAAWRHTVIVKEVFTRRLAAPTPSTQVTADANVADTFDGSGILGFTSEDKLLLAVGELEADDPETLLDRAEFYTLDPADPGAELQNFSMTSGETTTPFQLGGELDLRDFAETPDGERLLLEFDPDDGDQGFTMLDLAVPGALTTVIPGGDQLGTLVPAGPSTLVVRPQLGPAPVHLDVLTPDHEVLALPLPLSAVSVDRFAADRRGLRAACVATLADGTELPLLLDLVGGAVAPLTPAAAAASEGLAFAPDGRVLLGLGDPQRFGLVLPGMPTLPLALPRGDALPLAP